MTDFKAKMHQIRFRLGLRPRPRWGTYSAPQTHLLDLGPLRGRGGAGLRKMRERGRGSGGREREGPQVTVAPGPLRDLLRHYGCTRKAREPMKVNRT